MASSYLTLADAPAYGLNTVSQVQINGASALIDAYLRRPEGLLWTPDAAGQPCYMTGAEPDYSLTLTGSIAPGSNVPVTFASGPYQILQVGDQLVLEYGVTANASALEVVTLATVPLPGNSAGFTFQSVSYAHSAGAIAAHGLVIEEQKYMPKSRPITMMSRTPLVRVLSGVGRYGYGRRGEGADYNMEQFNLLAALSKFGGPPYWELFQPAYAQNWDPNTGQLWVPAGVMLAYYSEVKVRYVAGFSTLPAAVEAACVQIIQAMQANPVLGDIKGLKAGDTAIQYAASSVMSADVKAMLSPYAVRINL
ncbi:MAG: hypothetical protein KGL39_32245 [Patescibacteria group bacterium]|nr:hypothetical protein [Patescibacteria group bacterium]